MATSPMDPVSARADIDTRLQAQIPALQAKQNAFVARGMYFQGLWTHSTPPADGVDAAPDLASSSPAYQGVTWVDEQALPATMNCRVRIDQYVGPNGPGYCLTAQATLQGRLWQRSINFGPTAEDWRTQAWADVTVTGMP